MLGQKSGKHARPAQKVQLLTHGIPRHVNKCYVRAVQSYFRKSMGASISRGGKAVAPLGGKTIATRPAD